MDFEVCDKFCWSQLTMNIAHCTVHGSTLRVVEQRDINWWMQMYVGCVVGTGI